MKSNSISTKEISEEIENLNQSFEKELDAFSNIISLISKKDLDEKKKEKNIPKSSRKQELILSAEILIEKIEHKGFAICKDIGIIFFFNGKYWEELQQEQLKKTLRIVSLNLGIDEFNAKCYRYLEDSYKQFLSAVDIHPPVVNNFSTIINFNNGTYVFDTNNKNITGQLKNFNSLDFCKYCLPFDFNPEAKAPIFNQYLDQVLPDLEVQNVLAEYIAYLFARNLKLEKVLILQGFGANGKSVFFDIIHHLLGIQNVSNFSLNSITDSKGYYRAKLKNVLLNYCSEISKKFNVEVFKQLVSGEPVGAKALFKDPVIIYKYAKLIFNCNEFPISKEFNHAFYRRFLIIPFNKTIPPEKQDKLLSKKIIENELPGVFNWVLEGSKRLHENKRFSHSDIITNALTDYQSNSDNVLIFLKERNYEKSNNKWILIKTLFEEYHSFCIEDNYKSLSKQNFKKRLESQNFSITRKTHGNSIELEKIIK
mgnify:CR=1 FL=1